MLSNCIMCKEINSSIFLFDNSGFPNLPFTSTG